ncbi:LPS-assembly protein LptD [Caminibacter pacificus]
MRALGFLLILFSFLSADYLKIFATSVKEVNNTVILQNPVILYRDYIIQAKNGILKNKKTLYLKKDVVVFYKNDTILANSATVYSKNDILIQDIFLVDKSSDIWIKAKNSHINGDILKFNSLTFSSCCVEKPDWYLYSTTGEYNKKTKYMRLYHVTLYIGKVPVFYFPFYFNSLNKQRRSGLLRPYVGYSAKEGFLYSQPIYIVLGQRADTEITPTIRTMRGRGIYNTFRFVDSPYSFGTIRFGEFVDFDSYYRKYQLAHKKHYGYEIEYKRDRVFDNDSLYAKIKYANDVDYFYLNPYNYTFDTRYLVDTLITSKINYIKNVRKNYIFGMYAKYFIDTTKVNNDDTIQILPQLNFHKFSTKSFYIINSFDANFYNYYSKPKKYFQNDLSIPAAINFSMFNDYLKLKISEHFNYVNANYYNSKTKPQYFYQLYNSLKFYTSLTKVGNYIHIINPSIQINTKQLNKLTEQNDLLNYTKINDSLSLSIFQIFEKGDFYLDHTINENLDLNFKNKQPLENILNISKGDVKITENNKFDWDLNRVVYNTFSISFPLSSYYFKFSHLYSYSSSQTIQTYTVRMEKNFNAYKKGYFEYNYDMENRYVKYMLVGVKLNKKCWQYDINFKKSRIPVLKDTGVSYSNNYLVGINVNFYPIGGLKQMIQLK